jgi:hypothetical protein
LILRRRKTILGNSFEGNWIGIDANHIGSFAIISNSIQGAERCPEWGVATCDTNSSFQRDPGACKQWPFTQQAFMSNEAPVKSVCMAAFMNNTGSGGLWSLPGDLSGLTLIQCNNP